MKREHHFAVFGIPRLKKKSVKYCGPSRCEVAQGVLHHTLLRIHIWEGSASPTAMKTKMTIYTTTVSANFKPATAKQRSQVGSVELIWVSGQCKHSHMALGPELAAGEQRCSWANKLWHSQVSAHRHTGMSCCFTSAVFVSAALLILVSVCISMLISVGLLQ